MEDDDKDFITKIISNLIWTSSPHTTSFAPNFTWTIESKLLPKLLANVNMVKTQEPRVSLRKVINGDRCIYVTNYTTIIVVV